MPYIHTYLCTSCASPIIAPDRAIEKYIVSSFSIDIFYGCDRRCVVRFRAVIHRTYAVGALAFGRAVLYLLSCFGFCALRAQKPKHSKNGKYHAAAAASVVLKTLRSGTRCST